MDIVVECHNRKFHGMGLATDIVESSAKAMVHVLNSIWRSEQVEIEKQKINQESQSNTKEAV